MRLLILVGVLALMGCGGKAADASGSSRPAGPVLTPVVEAVAWVNKMPGVMERDASGKPIYPGHLVVKVYGDAQVFKLEVSNQSKQLGEFTGDQLIRREMEKSLNFMVNKDLRIDQGDTLSVKVWMVVNEKDTVQSYIQNVPVKVAY